VENVDYRKNRQLKVRRVPYNLPENIKQKVMLLMEDLNLSTGSIDFLKSNDGNYYFLEVNPEGQIGMVSNLCNYDIEHKIVKKINV
jgi:glutathione synthase/RimK-type ligase-like ATP-grasp enzyme